MSGRPENLARQQRLIAPEGDAQGAGAAAPPDRLRGVIEHFVFHNEESGWGVARLTPDERSPPVTVTGVLYGVEEGQEVSLVGRWEEHKKYGRQFGIKDVEIEAPTTRRGLIRFLGSGTLPGIGMTLAERIVDKFGDDTLRIFDEEPKRLCEVEGVGRKKLRRIRDAWEEQRDRRQAFIFLQGHGVGPGQAARIFKEWRSSAITRVNENPYSLTVFHGIGFKRADVIARELGVEGDDPRRLAAGIVYVLHELTDDGHTCSPESLLVEQAARLLGTAEEKAQAALSGLLDTRQLLLEESPERHVFLPILHESESTIASELVRILKGSYRSTQPRGDAANDSTEPLTPIEADDPLPNMNAGVLCAGIGIALDPVQEEAVRTALCHRLTVITGGPGVGKTTVVRAIVTAADTLGWEVRLGAPTGRAAKRLSEATGNTATTLHRMLKWEPMSGVFQHNADNPLEGNLFVVDETSMVDTDLMQKLLLAIPIGARLVLVGDVDQLPSVGPGEVLRDIIASGVAEVIRLTKIFRQAAGGLIIENAHRINTGEMPQAPAGSELSDFYIVREDDPEKAREMILRLVTERIPQRFGLDPMRDVQVMAPMYRGACGTDALNFALGEALNPGARALAPDRPDSSRAPLRIGDRVMQTTNDYEREIYNGDLGILLTYDEKAGSATVRFDERIVKVDDQALANLVPAYAISIHKSQGSEYPAVVIPLLTEHYIMLRRRLLYTAVTRGKKLVILVGSRRALEQAVRSGDGSSVRYTRLETRIREALRDARPGQP